MRCHQYQHQTGTINITIANQRETKHGFLHALPEAPPPHGCACRRFASEAPTGCEGCEVYMFASSHDRVMFGSLALGKFED